MCVCVYSGVFLALVGLTGVYFQLNYQLDPVKVRLGNSPITAHDSMFLQHRRLFEVSSGAREKV